MLTAEQKQRVTELTKLLGEVDKKLDALNEEVTRSVQGVPAAELAKKYAEAHAARKGDREAIMKERAPLLEEREQLAPSPQRVAFVWLYENTTPAAKSN